jgi:hypothetical protein
MPKTILKHETQVIETKNGELMVEFWTKEVKRPNQYGKYEIDMERLERMMHQSWMSR